jgi:hypothetical protein
MPLPIPETFRRLGILENPETGLIYLALMMAPFSEAQVLAASQQLGLTRLETEVILKSRDITIWNESDPGLIYDALQPLPYTSACVGVILAADFEKALSILTYYKENLEGVTLETTGDDILALGVVQGERVGQLLKALRHAKLKGEIRHKIEELAWIQKEIT